MADARQFYIGAMRALEHPDLTDGDQVVYDALCAHANREGLCWPSIETLQRMTRGRTDRAVRKSLRALESAGLIKTWKAGSFNRYQVLYDASEVAIQRAIEDPSGHRNAGSGVTSDKQHRNGGSGVGEPEPPFRSGTQVPVERNAGSGETGTQVPGERVQEREQEQGAAIARGASSTTTRGEATVTTETRDSVALAKELAIAANQALRDNPKMRAQEQFVPLRPDLALAELREWLAEEIPFPVILETVVACCAKFRPAQRNDRISSFAYFDRAVRAAWGAAQMNAAVDAAPKTGGSMADALARLSQEAAA